MSVNENLKSWTTGLRPTDRATDNMRITFSGFDDLTPLSELRESKHQRNKHPDDQIERLALIMLKHGVRHPIHVSSLSGEVCFGHGRWMAAKKNGWDKYPVVYQDFASDDEEYACVQSDNAVASWAELDLSAINTDLMNLGPDFDLDLLGIKNFNLDFEPGTEDEQGQLDQKKLVFMECPHCNKKFEKDQARVVEA